MKDVLYVPPLKKNIPSIFALDAKRIIFAFVEVQVLMCPKGKTTNDATMIGAQEGGLYKLKGQPKQAFIHDSIEPSEIWNKVLHMLL